MSKPSQAVTAASRKQRLQGQATHSVVVEVIDLTLEDEDADVRGGLEAAWWTPRPRHGHTTPTPHTTRHLISSQAPRPGLRRHHAFHQDVAPGAMLLPLRKVARLQAGMPVSENHDMETMPQAAGGGLYSRICYLFAPGHVDHQADAMGAAMHHCCIPSPCMLWVDGCLTPQYCRAYTSAVETLPVTTLVMMNSSPEVLQELLPALPALEEVVLAGDPRMCMSQATGLFAPLSCCKHLHTLSAWLPDGPTCCPFDSQALHALCTLKQLHALRGNWPWVLDIHQVQMLHDHLPALNHLDIRINCTSTDDDCMLLSDGSDSDSCPE